MQFYHGALAIEIGSHLVEMQHLNVLNFVSNTAPVTLNVLGMNPSSRVYKMQ